MALFEKTGGLKLHVGKKDASGYLIAAALLSLVLAAGTGYSVWYASSLVQKLSAPAGGDTLNGNRFQIEQAKADLRLQGAEYWMQNFRAASSTATTTPKTSPSPKR